MGMECRCIHNDNKFDTRFKCNTGCRITFRGCYGQVYFVTLKDGDYTVNRASWGIA